MYQLTIVGGGPGNGAYMLPRAKEVVEQAGYVFADQRYIDMVPHQRREVFGKIAHISERIKSRLQECSVAVIVSGDPLFYSLTKMLFACIPKENIKIIPGISSVNYMAALCKKTVEKAVFVSSHGQEAAMDEIISYLYEGRDVYMLCDGSHGPDWLAGELCCRHLENIPMAAGIRLSYEDEQLIQGDAKTIVCKNFESLCVAAVFGSDYMRDVIGTRNKEKITEKQKLLLSDGDFIRNKVPMTREEVRWIILGKLHLFPGAQVWDIGAGTGSVSVECARMLNCFGKGHVYSVERNPAAAELIRSNKDKYQLSNMTVIEGDALESMSGLPVPDIVFIGGSGKELPYILENIQKIGAGIRVVTACVTLETLSEALDAYGRLGYTEAEMIQINISKGKTLGNYHVLNTSHPITIFSASTLLSTDKDNMQIN